MEQLPTTTPQVRTWTKLRKNSKTIKPNPSASELNSPILLTGSPNYSIYENEIPTVKENATEQITFEYALTSSDITTLIENLVQQMQQHILYQRFCLMNKTHHSKEDLRLLQKLTVCDYYTSNYQEHRQNCNHSNKVCVWKQGTYLLSEFSSVLADFLETPKTIAKVIHVTTDSELQKTAKNGHSKVTSSGSHTFTSF